MATQPAYPRNTGSTAQWGVKPQPVAARAEADPCQLRALPFESVFFHCKTINNARLVREPDLQARGICWKTIGVAAVLVASLGTVLAPSVGSTLAGYRLEELRAEERRLLEEGRGLELEEARLLHPQRLEELARKHQLVAPSPGQVIHLDTKDGAVAMVTEQ